MEPSSIYRTTFCGVVNFLFRFFVTKTFPSSFSRLVSHRTTDHPTQHRVGTTPDPNGDMCSHVGVRGGGWVIQSPPGPSLSGGTGTRQTGISGNTSSPGTRPEPSRGSTNPMSMRPQPMDAKTEDTFYELLEVLSEDRVDKGFRQRGGDYRGWAE